MSDDDKNDIRGVGYGVIGSAIVFLIYDTLPFVIKNDWNTVTVKMLVFTVAIVGGILLLKILPKISHLSNRTVFIIVGILVGFCVLLLITYYANYTHHITIKTDWSTYANVTTITVSGDVNPIVPNEKISILILYPDGGIYNSTTVSLIGDSNHYEYNFHIQPLGNSKTTVFNIGAMYEGNMTWTSFECENSRFPSLEH